MNIEESRRRLNSLVEAWEKQVQKPSMCTIDEDDIEAIKCLLEENKRLKKWNINKDTRNSRQRIANKNLLKENIKLRQLNKIVYVDKSKKILDELGKWLEKRIKSYEDRKELGSGYELSEVMQIELTCDRRYMRKIKELKGE